MRHHASQDLGKSGAPIAQVLNDTNPAQDTINPVSTASHTFSGSLADLLLDTTGQLHQNERRRVEHQHDEPSRIAGETPVFKLPQLPVQPAKAAERTRLPPLLQGLHQPPPLPASGRLFPPITDGASGFEQDIRNRFHSANASHEARSRASDDSALTRTADPNDLNEVNDEHDREEREDLLSAECVNIRGKEQSAATTHDASEHAADASGSKGRKRKKWSDDETRDLLLGVSRFGIGKWKRILQCPDYAFHERTAVDLKDRFRVCCPDEGARKTRAKRQVEGETSTTSQRRSTQSKVSTDKSATESDAVPTRKEVTGEDAEDGHRAKHPKLVELGIHAPFAKSTRRPRQKFTSRDDENLKKGFEKYGAAWHSMRDDQELGFGTRHPTDLRDRFRIRYPDVYADAGYKTKPKHKIDRVAGIGVKGKHATTDLSKEPEQTGSEPKEKRRSIEACTTEATVSDTTERSLSLTSGARHFPYTSYPMDSSTFLFGDVTSGIPQDKDGSFSPIILNRNILQWADANNFLMAHTSTTSSNPYVASHALDMSMHITYPNDGIHIDPMATLKLPLMATGSHNNISSGNSGSSFMLNYTNNPPPPTTANTRSSYSTATSDTLSVPNSWPTTSKTNSSDDLLRTPNLPTIVFPHVPAASARGAVHNLPTPADLLSGMGHGGDTDVDGDFNSWGAN
jgi:hypothetical protein